MRIAKALALAGIDSRRKCEIHIRNGAVKVNGEVVRDLGRQVDRERDEIAFRGRAISFERYVYYVMHKPAGYTTTASDPHAKKTVYHLLPSTLVRGTHRPEPGKRRVFPVGRLDRDSTGLLLFTNDGDLANILTHPRYGIGKCYDLKLDRPFDARDVKRLLAGVVLDDGLAKVEKVERHSKRFLRIFIREGKKRELRRIFESLGYGVEGLCRIAFGPLTLGTLAPAQGRFLNKREIDRLKSALGRGRSSEGQARK